MKTLVWTQINRFVFAPIENGYKRKRILLKTLLKVDRFENDTASVVVKAKTDRFENDDVSIGKKKVTMIAVTFLLSRACAV